MKRLDRIFWVIFALFCALMVAYLTHFYPEIFDPRTKADEFILTTMLLLCGAVLRYWLYKNKHKFIRQRD